MKVRTSIIAAGAAVVLSSAGAVAAPALASAHSASHTLKFTTEMTGAVGFTQRTGASRGTDLNSKGKTIGFDVAYVTLRGMSATLNLAFDISGGLLYATATTTNGGKTFTGPVTGGTGAFKGATGTITATTISSTKKAVTIKYR
jgi:ABC-type amino acid transport substrate-binding protein